MTFDEMFEVFWSEYPRRLAKKAARKAFMRIGWSERSFSTVMACLRQQKEFLWHATDVQFLPHAATWLNGERWDDEIPDWKPVGVKNERETDHEKNRRAGQEFLDREMAREMRGDVSDVREDPRRLPGKV